LQPFPRITGRHYFAIFVLASVTLSYQILITRFFSVMLYYHFAFAAISLAMLGLTRGAMVVYNNPVRYAPERVGSEFARHASRFAVTGVGAMICFLCAPVLVPLEYLWLALLASTIFFVVPSIIQLAHLWSARSILTIRTATIWKRACAGATADQIEVIERGNVLRDSAVARWIGRIPPGGLLAQEVRRENQFG